MSIDKAMIIANLKQHPSGIIGFGCWWAWLLAALNSPLLFSNSSAGIGAPTSSLNLFAVLFGAVLSFALSFGIKKTPRVKTRRILVLGSAVLLSVCTVLTYNLGHLPVPQDIALMVIGAVIGIALSLLQILWGTCYFTNISGSAIGIVSASSFVLALVLSFLVLDKGAMSIWFVALLPLASGALLAKNDAREKDEGQQVLRDHTPRAPLPLNLIVLMVLFGASFGVFRMLFLPSSVTASFSSFYYMAIVSIVPMAATLILVIVLRKESYLGIALTIALPFITLGIFVLSLFGSENQSLELALISAGVRCVDIVIWIMVAHIAKQPASSPYKVFSFGRGLSCIGALCGFALGSWHTITPSQSLSVSIFVLLLLLAASAFSVVNVQKNFPDQSGANAPSPTVSGSTEEAVRMIANEYHLSARELEVLELLNAGRTVAYIASKLVVANSTVATHVNHIYRKLDVHNRQELLDFIESHRREASDTSI